MVQLLERERVAHTSTEPDQHILGGTQAMPTDSAAGGIPPQMPSPTPDVLQSIRIGLRDIAGETARNIQRLSQATVEQALEIGQRLWRMQKDLKRKEYSQFLSVLGWASAKARKFINLAKVFSGFEPSQLIRVELTTLLSLTSKRYQAVVAQLREAESITQQLVEQLIKETKKPRTPKSDPISGWKANRAGGSRRYEVILHDEETGLSIEQQAEAEAILPQRVIQEGVALRAQYKEGLPQPNEYYRAQLKELKDVVDNARELELDNRQLKLKLSNRDRLIADLEAKLTERASVSTELSASGRSCLDVGQESETTQHSAEQEETEATQATDSLESALEDDLLASVPQKEPVEHDVTITIPQDAVASELMEEFLATIVPQSPEAEPVSDGSTTTVPNAVASEPAEPASQPSASDGASTALQPLVVDWEVLKQLRDAEGSLRKIDTLIQDLNSRLAQSGSNVVERELRPVLKKQQHLRSTTVDQIVALIDSNVIPAYYEELQNKGRVVLDPKYASDILVQAQSWSDVVMIVGGNAKQLLAAVKPWSFDEKQHLVRLLSTYP